MGLGAYFLSLTLENVRCFRERQTLRLADAAGRPARWTVLLGENGTGKTTLLQALVTAAPSPVSLQELRGVTRRQLLVTWGSLILQDWAKAHLPRNHHLGADVEAKCRFASRGLDDPGVDVTLGFFIQASTFTDAGTGIADRVPVDRTFLVTSSATTRPRAPTVLSPSNSASRCARSCYASSRA
jgi:energy-coupling factor transporter ATP-binding protein EcfA2